MKIRQNKTVLVNEKTGAQTSRRNRLVEKVAAHGRARDIDRSQFRTSVNLDIVLLVRAQPAPMDSRGVSARLLSAKQRKRQIAYTPVGARSEPDEPERYDCCQEPCPRPHIRRASAIFFNSSYTRCTCRAVSSFGPLVS